MARADTVTRLPLDRWFAIMGIHPLHGNGVYLEDVAASIGCSTPWLQYSWQDIQRIGREDVTLAIAQAEADLERYLGYRLLPTWEADEWRPTERPYRSEFVNLSGLDVRGYRQAVKANWGHMITGGIEAKDVLPGASAIAYTPALPAYQGTATVTVVTTVTNPCEIAIYYPGESGADEWEIRPINVSIAGGTATITFRREQAVLANLLEALDAQGVNGYDPANFLTNVDVYRRYNEPGTQATLMWEPLGGCSCGTSTCLACAFTTQTGCLHPRGDPRLSMIAWTAATWDAVNQQFDVATPTLNRQPDIVRLYYRAGLRSGRVACSVNQMDPEWERAVAYMAAALLERPLCECGPIHQRVEQWRVDLAFSSGATELASYSMSSRDLDNPFGTRRGQVFAWKRAQREALGEAVFV